MAASTEMFVAFLSRRVLMTVPSRISRMMSSSARLRAHQASQSAFTLRQARLTGVFADSPLEQRKQRALHPPRVRTREINRRDQRFGRLGQPLIAR